MAKRGLNKSMLIGHAGRDAELKSMPSGGQVATVSIATSESWKDPKSGEKKEHTEWHNVVFYKKLAEIAAKYIKKGQQVYVEGSMRTRKWQGKDGKDRYTTEIVVRDMELLGGKPSTEPKAAHSEARDTEIPPPPEQPQGHIPDDEDGAPF